jgi:hypothetical protein
MGKRKIGARIRGKVSQGSDYLAVQLVICRFFVVASLVKLGRVVEGCFRGVAILHAKTVEDFAGVSRLRNRNRAGRRRSVNVEREKTFDGAEVFDGESSGEVRMKSIYVRNRI